MADDADRAELSRLVRFGDAAITTTTPRSAPAQAPAAAGISTPVVLLGCAALWLLVCKR